jgi:hypothetical protein
MLHKYTFNKGSCVCGIKPLKKSLKTKCLCKCYANILSIKGVVFVESKRAWKQNVYVNVTHTDISIKVVMFVKSKLKKRSCINVYINVTQIFQ